MNLSLARFCLMGMILVLSGPSGWAELTHEMPASELRDKIRGGLLGQLLGNLNGLPHEMRYIQEPGQLTAYCPALPEGAWTDDDTDFEWVYLVAMQQAGTVLLSGEQIADLWIHRINRRIWCANQYARQLMDLGLVPPLTGCFALNPWAEFNISGQFLCETFGLLAPGMPQTAARIGLNYTTVAIDLEPAQTTQLFTAMIATAFLTNRLEAILEAGLASVDPRSRLPAIVRDVRLWHRRHPYDWRQTRRLVQEKYARFHGAMRDRNGYELNTASTIAALLYGQGNFTNTLQIAFNFGWDCDNNAATAGTVVGVLCGYRHLLSQGWPIVDRYRNTTRGQMPEDETITSFADRIVDLAEMLILQRGGQRQARNGHIVYRIALEPPGMVMPLPDLEAQRERLRREMAPQIEAALAGQASRQEMARAAYLAICLDLAPAIGQAHAEGWSRGLAALGTYEQVVQALYHHADVPAGDRFRQKAQAAGLQEPKVRKDLW